VTFKRASNLFVRTNASGDIVSIFWPYESPIDEKTGEEQAGGPSQTGVGLSDGEEMYVVAVPDELYHSTDVPALPADLFNNYDLQVPEQGEQGRAVLVRRPPEAPQ